MYLMYHNRYYINKLLFDTIHYISETRGASIPNSVHRNDRDESSHYKLFLVSTFPHTHSNGLDFIFQWYVIIIFFPHFVSYAGYVISDICPNITI